MVQAVGHIARLLEADLQLDPLRQSLLEALQRRLDAGGHLQYVVSLLLVGRHEHGALAVVSPGVTPRLRAPADVGYVAHVYDVARSRGYDGIAYLSQRVVAAGRPQGKAARADVDDAAGNVGILALQRLRYL